MPRPAALASVLFLGLALAVVPTISATDAVPSTTYGEGVDIETATPLADILADPASYDGRTVRVEGMVNDVCPMAGCWMMLTDGDATLRVKVEDGVIVFPQEAKGHRAAAQGVVSVREVERDAYVAWHAHLAEEKGETFDPDSVGDGPYRIVQIQGTGAVVE